MDRCLGVNLNIPILMSTGGMAVEFLSQCRLGMQQRIRSGKKPQPRNQILKDANFGSSNMKRFAHPKTLESNALASEPIFTRVHSAEAQH